MPVKSDTMFEIWNESSLYTLEEDDYTIKFLDIPDEALLNGLDKLDSAHMDLSDLLQEPSSPKYQIRHHDCMWSGTCVDKSHPTKKKCAPSTCLANVVTLPPPTATDIPLMATAEAQKAQLDVQTTKIGTQKTIMTPDSIKTIVCKEKIPAGRSLLINSRTSSLVSNSQSKKIAYTTKLSVCSSLDVKPEFENIINILRPDTPLSLGDDATDFRNHTIDLTPCPSSNRIKFSDPQSTKIINMYREHLEETSNSLNDSNPFFVRNGQRTSTTDLNEILTDITFLSDYEDLADDSSVVDMDDEHDHLNEIDNKTNKIGKMLMANVMLQGTSSSSRTISHHHEYMGDHSYTRPKGSRYDPIALGVQTPSDSEEEIDVVSMSEKNLPTNPSARDRRALQTTVAHKIARSKHSSSQRNRVLDDDSISSSTSTLSSKGSTPIKIGSQTPLRYVSNHLSGHGMSRKRQAQSSKDASNNNHDSHKKYHKSGHKKQRLMHIKNQQKVIDPDEAETVEKRNLHNNMERQRRIGLKNLFEELKCQIPSLKDKERAPKVNILREAAVFCSKLRREEDLHAELMKKHNRLMSRVRTLKASIAAQQRRNH